MIYEIAFGLFSCLQRFMFFEEFQNLDKQYTIAGEAILIPIAVKDYSNPGRTSSMLGKSHQYRQGVHQPQLTRTIVVAGEAILISIIPYILNPITVKDYSNPGQTS